MAKSSDRFYPTDNFTLDLRTSCTKEEAAAKLIGWMMGHVRHDYPVDVDEDEITSDNLVYTHSLVYGLQEHLTILRNAEWSRYNAAVCEGLPEEVLKEKAEALAECDDLIRKVAMYLCDIDEELDKEFDQTGASVLRIDRQATADSGKIHITIRSLDKWSQGKYGISILDPDSVSTPSIEGIANAASQRRTNQEDDADAKGRVSKAVVDRIYTTFAITLEAYVATLPDKYRKHGSSINVSAVAEHLQKLAENANKKINLPADQQRGLYGQDSETLRKLIAKALEAKRQEIMAG